MILYHQNYLPLPTLTPPSHDDGSYAGFSNLYPPPPAAPRQSSSSSSFSQVTKYVICNIALCEHHFMLSFDTGWAKACNLKEMMFALKMAFKRFIQMGFLPCLVSNYVCCSTELQWWSLKAAAPTAWASASTSSTSIPTAPTSTRTSGMSKFQYSVI